MQDLAFRVGGLRFVGLEFRVSGFRFKISIQDTDGFRVKGLVGLGFVGWGPELGFRVMFFKTCMVSRVMRLA